MNQPEPIEKTPELDCHPADKTLASLENDALALKKELIEVREKLQDTPPEPKELQEELHQKYDELMDTLKIQHNHLKINDTEL